MRKDSANNKSNYSEKELPSLDSRSRRFTLERVFGERLLTQVLQHVQLLIESFGSTPLAGFPDLGQPLRPMSTIIDISSRTWNRPAPIHRFQPVHDPRQIFDDGQITSGEFPQHAYAGFAVINRRELIAA